MLRVLELREQTGILKQLAEKHDAAPEFLKLLELKEQTQHLKEIAANRELQKGADGENGLTPVKGVDYLTPEEVDVIKQELTPVKGIHYVDGEKGEPGNDGHTPIAGVDYLIPKDGENGTSVSIEDAKAMLTELLEELEAADVGAVTQQDVEALLKKHLTTSSNSLKQEIATLRNKVELNYGGHGGSGGTSTHFATNEVVAGSGTSFTLAHTPTAGTQAIYALGQRLTLTTDYTIAGAVITTVSTWNAGEIIADYQY